jgi:hypothetical protein
VRWFPIFVYDRIQDTAALTRLRDLAETGPSAAASQDRTPSSGSLKHIDSSRRAEYEAGWCCCSKRIPTQMRVDASGPIWP